MSADDLGALLPASVTSRQVQQRRGWNARARSGPEAAQCCCCCMVSGARFQLAGRRRSPVEGYWVIAPISAVWVHHGLVVRL